MSLASIWDQLSATKIFTGRCREFYWDVRELFVTWTMYLCLAGAGHDTRVSKVLLVLSKAGLTLNRDKCKFGLSEVNFLGHVIGASGIKADPEKISATASYPVPKSKKEISVLL